MLAMALWTNQNAIRYLRKILSASWRIRMTNIVIGNCELKIENWKLFR